MKQATPKQSPHEWIIRGQGHEVTAIHILTGKQVAMAVANL